MIPMRNHFMMCNVSCTFASTNTMTISTIWHKNKKQHNKELMKVSNLVFSVTVAIH